MRPQSMWKLPLKGSKEYNALVTMSGLLIGLGWVVRDELENPKWFGVPRAIRMESSEIEGWNKQFGPKDENKWAVSPEENSKILNYLNKNEKIEIGPKTEKW